MHFPPTRDQREGGLLSSFEQGNRDAITQLDAVHRTARGREVSRNAPRFTTEQCAEIRGFVVTIAHHREGDAMRGSLTDRQVRFVHEYLLDFSATNAAIRAGYSKRSARTIGQELLRHPALTRFLQDRQRVHLTRLDFKAADVLEGYRRIAAADPRLAIEPGTGHLRKLCDLPDALALAIDAFEVDAEGRIVKIRFCSRIAALDWLKQRSPYAVANENSWGVGGLGCLWRVRITQGNSKKPESRWPGKGRMRPIKGGQNRKIAGAHAAADEPSRATGRGWTWSGCRRTTCLSCGHHGEGWRRRAVRD
jgi:hypothetical protein